MTIATSKLFERGYALIVGIGDYGDPRWNIPTAAQDALVLSQTLVDPQVAGYARAQVELLLDRHATRAGLLAALRYLASRCRPEDIVLISMTCQSIHSGDGTYAFVVSDPRLGSSSQESIADNMLLTTADLVLALREIRAQQLLLLLNVGLAAYSRGTLEQVVSKTPSANNEISAMFPEDVLAALLATGDGRAVLTACRPEQRSYFQLGERHSYFGQALIDALRSASTDAHGYVGLYELYNSVYHQVRDVTTRRLGVPQEPVLTLVKGVGPYPVARSRHEANRDAVTEQKRTLIDFGGATVQGSVTVNNVATGNTITIGESDTKRTRESPDPLQDLPILRERLVTARNVDEDARDDAAAKLDLAYRALTRGDSARASRRLDEALTILREMNNNYIRSIVRKLEVLRDAV